MSMCPSPVAVVTGAASGISRAFVVALKRRGYHCVAADVDAASPDGLAAAPEAAGVLTLPTNVSRAWDVERLAHKAFTRLGHIDLLINHAGLPSSGSSWELSEAQWRRVLDTNLFSLVHAVRNFVPRLIANSGSGHIVNIASMAALTSGATVGPYSTSKLAQCRSPVRVSVVFPDAVRTRIDRPLLSRADRPAEAIDEVLERVIAQGMAFKNMVEAVLAEIAAGTSRVFPHSQVREAAHVLPGAGAQRRHAVLSLFIVPLEPLSCH